jgi:hypothetical protein
MMAASSQRLHRSQPRPISTATPQQLNDGAVFTTKKRDESTKNTGHDIMSHHTENIAPHPIQATAPQPTVSMAICNIVAAACMVVIMAVLLWRSPSHRIYDERYHLDRADQLARGRPMGQVFTEPTPSAVGPVFPIFMWGVQSLFGPDARLARAATLMAMLVCLALTAKALQLFGKEPSECLLLFAVVPFVVSSLMALTEIWALVPAFAAFVILWMQPPGRRHLFYLLASGACFALAVLTRQSTIILLPALIIAAVKKRGFSLSEVVVLGFPSAAAILLLLSLWGGLLPPGQEHLSQSGSFSYDNFIKGAVYCALMGILMNPRLLLQRTMLLAMAVTLGANLVTNAVSYPILLTVFPEHGSSTALFRKLFGGVGCGFTTGFFAIYAWQLRKDPRGPAMDCLFAVCLVAFSCGLITDSFSSRYLVLAIPFLALLVSSCPWRVPNFVMLACVASGFLLGLNSFRHYH